MTVFAAVAGIAVAVPCQPWRVTRVLDIVLLADVSMMGVNKEFAKNLDFKPIQLVLERADGLVYPDEQMRTR